MMTLEERVTKYLDACPAAIEGCNGDAQTFSIASALVWGFALEQGAALSWLRYYNQKCDPPWSDEELKRKIENTVRTPSRKPRGYLLREDGQDGCGTFHGSTATPLLTPTPPHPCWPSVVLQDTDRIVSAGPWLYDLWETSPVRFEHPRAESKAVEIVGHLFPGDPLLCCGWNRSRFDTRRRLAWSDELDRLALIVPSPMLAPAGRTRHGRVSKHTLEATAARVYLIVEFDFAARSKNGQPTVWTPLIESWQARDISIFDACAALLLHLAVFMPLACVTASGGKSLHGWHLVYGKPEAEQRAFMERAVALGADPALWENPSQFGRLPDGLRDGRVRQTCFFLNPEECVNL
jgi:hypothetical protein